MTIRFSKRELVLVLLAFFVVASLFAALYFYALKPLHSRLDQLRTEVANERKMLAALRKQTTEQQTDLVDSVVELQKKVPVKPFVEQFLLDLEKAEVVSQSFISSMKFAEETDVQQPQQTNPSDEPKEAGQPNEGASESEQASSEQGNASPPLPSGLKKVTVQLTVESPSYYQLERFLQTLEGLDRIVSVEELSFTGNPEMTSVETEIKPLTYSLKVSAFYHPGLSDLEKSMPPFETPPPGEKRNPLTELVPEEESERP